MRRLADGRPPKNDKQAGGVHPGPATAIGETVANITLRQAWERYLDAHLVGKNRSEKTIEGYRDHVDRIFAEWLDAPLLELATDPARVSKKHDQVTKETVRTWPMAA